MRTPTESLQSLLGVDDGQSGLEDRPARSAIDARLRRTRRSAGDSGAGGSDNRVYTEESRVEKPLSIPVSSGTTAVRFNYISSINFLDGDGLSHSFNYVDSTAPEPAP